jgi:exportin-1
MISMQVLKHEWPSKWPQFIPDLVAAAKSSETLCENCMVILKVRELVNTPISANTQILE